MVRLKPDATTLSPIRPVSGVASAFLTAAASAKAVRRTRSAPPGVCLPPGGLLSMRLNPLVTTAFIVFTSVAAFAQQGAAPAAPAAPAGQRAGAPGRGGAPRAGRAPLFFREEWKQTPAGG